MRRSRISRRSAALSFALLLAVTPNAALAQGGEGITIDPDSPPGKEYAIPLDDARGIGGGGGGGDPRPGAPPTEPFGEGITPAPRDEAPRDSTAGRPVARAHQRDRSPNDRPIEQSPVTVPADRAKSLADREAAGTSPWLLSVLAGIGVLALAGGVAVSVARRTAET